MKQMITPFDFAQGRLWQSIIFMGFFQHLGFGGVSVLRELIVFLEAFQLVLFYCLLMAGVTYWGYSTMKLGLLKMLDVLVWSLLTVGGINWGMIGIFNVDLIAVLFGSMTVVTRLIYALVGISALYEVLGVKSIAHRWDMHYRVKAA